MEKQAAQTKKVSRRVANQDSRVVVLAGKMGTHTRLVVVKWKEAQGHDGNKCWQLATDAWARQVCMHVHAKQDIHPTLRKCNVVLPS